MYRDDAVAGSWTALTTRIDTRRLLQRWAVVEPALAGLDDVAAVQRALARGGDPDLADAVLGALVRRAAAGSAAGNDSTDSRVRGGDSDALLLVLHLLSGVVLSLARQLSDLAPDMVQTVANELACQIRGYPVHRRTRAWAANLRAETRRAVLANYRPWVRLHPDAGENPLDPHSPLWEAIRPAAGTLTAQPAEDLDLVDLLLWAMRDGVDEADLALLIATETARSVAHGAAADRAVAAAHGVALRTFYRRRERTLTALRAAAASYLEAVA